jgi:hypothetical protein
LHREKIKKEKNKKKKGKASASGSRVDFRSELDVGQTGLILISRGVGFLILIQTVFSFFRC